MRWHFLHWLCQKDSTYTELQSALPSQLVTQHESFDKVWNPMLDGLLDSCPFIHADDLVWSVEHDAQVISHVQAAANYSPFVPVYCSTHLCCTAQDAIHLHFVCISAALTTCL